MIFVDSNVLIDMLEPDPVWAEWSRAQVRSGVQAGFARVTPIVVAEVGPKFATLGVFKAVLDDLGIGIEPMSEEAAFAAGEAFRAYRQVREGPKSILADFIIGGQAQFSGAKILTRDTRIYSRYFPDVVLIAPETPTND